MARTHETLVSLFDDIANAIRENTGSADEIIADDFPETIRNQITYGSVEVYELSGNTVELYNSSDILLESKDSPGGVNRFNIYQPGGYNVKVKKGSDLIWTKSFTASNHGNYIVKGRTTSKSDGGTETQRTITLTLAQLDEACKGGYAQHMFNIDDIYVPLTSGIFSKNKFYIQEFVEEPDGTTSVKFCQIGYFKTAAVMDYPILVSEPELSCFSLLYSCQGGYKYSAGRHRLLPKGTDVWSLASAIKPDGCATISTGFEFSKLRYSNYGKTDDEGKAGIYKYDAETDTFTEITEYQKHTLSCPLFIHGSFEAAGKLTEEQFNNGTYYRNDRPFYAELNQNINYYSLVSEWNSLSASSYYGFYQRTVNDGYFWSGVAPIRKYLKDMTLESQAGVYSKNGTNNIVGKNVHVDKLTIPSVHENAFNNSMDTYIWTRDGNYTFLPRTSMNIADKYSIYIMYNNAKYISGVTQNGQDHVMWKFQFLFN